MAHSIAQPMAVQGLGCSLRSFAGLLRFAWAKPFCRRHLTEDFSLPAGAGMGVLSMKNEKKSAEGIILIDTQLVPLCRGSFATRVSCSKCFAFLCHLSPWDF